MRWHVFRNHFHPRRLDWICLLCAAGFTAPVSALTPDEEEPLTAPLKVESLPDNFYTFEPDETTYTDQSSWWLNFSEWIIAQREMRSVQVQSVGAWADRTLSGDTRALPLNESYLRLGIATTSETGDLAQIEPEARFRLDLPTAKEKLRLVVESDSEETTSLGERDRDRQLVDSERSDNEATGALRYLTDITDTLNISNDVGARLHFPPDAFWRLRSTATFDLDANWQLGVDQRIYYFHQDGWGESTYLGFSRRVGPWDFISSSELRWIHSDREFEFSQIFSLYQRLNNRAELNPRIGILGESQPGWRTTEYFGDLTYRYRLFSTWLYAEAIPAINFTREESFDSITSLTLRIEMFFSGDIK